MLPAVVAAQAINFTTTAPLTVVSGPDKLGLAGSTMTITNSLTSGQAPISGTTNQYTTTITATDPAFPVSSVNGAATVTINYVAPGSPSNGISVAATVTVILIKLNINSTVLVPSITGISPSPIAATSLLSSSDTLTISDTSSSTVYSLVGGTISSSPAQGTCVYTVSPTSLNFPAAGGTLPVQLSVIGTACPWTASPGEGWLSLSANSGTGSQTISVTAAPNSLPTGITGSVTIAGTSIPVSQAGTNQCVYNVTPSSLTYGSTGGVLTLNVAATPSTCPWSATSALPWLTLSSSGGTGSGSVMATAAPNSESTALSGTITVAGQTIPVAEATASSCAFTVTPLSLSYTGAGTTGTGPSLISVVASSNSCTWSASSDQSWDTLSSSGGIGTGTVSLSVATNTGVARTSTLTIAGQSVAVSQSNTSTCTFSLSPTSLTFPSSGGVLDVTVNAGQGCSWSVSGSPAWVTLGATNGVGPGIIAVTAPAYTASQSRSGTLIAAGISIPVVQTSSSGCVYTVSPTTLNFSGAGGSLGVSITTAPSTCTWTASSPAGWASLSAKSGTGNATLTVAAAVNTSNSSRSLTLNVAGQSVLVTEAPATCTYSVNPTSLSFTSAGGVLPIQLLASSSACTWSASSNAGWATVSQTSGTGAVAVQVTATTNATNSLETGAVTIAGISVPITEAASNGCTFTVTTLSLAFPSGGGQVVRSIGASSSSCAWTASAPSWITLSATGGTGNGSLLIQAGSNATGASLSGAVIVAGQSIPVSEAGGCSYTVSPTSVYVDSTTQSVPFTISANPSSCLWTTTAPGFTLPFNPPSGTGSATAELVFPVNSSGADLTGTATVAGQAVAVNQAFTPQIFADVTANDYYFDAVNLLAQKNITSGCSTTPFNFCPTAQITRAQMAVFIVTAMYGGDNFTASQTPYFADVPVGSFAFNWIQKLYELGITAGCGSGNYCPNSNIDRDAMAVFLIKARYGATTLFTYPSTPYFSDVPATYWAFPWIQRLAQDSITSGCGAGAYCPGNPVVRSDMAIFVMRALFNQLLPTGTSVISQATPNVLTPGVSQTVTLIGLNTNWLQDTSALSPIPGVLVGSIKVSSPTVMSVTLIPQTNAPAQPDSILVVTGSEQDVLPSAIVIQ